MTANKELLPCPFCGIEPKVVEDNGYRDCQILCNCLAEPCITFRQDKLENAKIAWNRRPEASIEQEQGRRLTLEDAWHDMLERRSIAEGHICQKCSGYGVVVYGSTATWRRGAGGQILTPGVCDKCWGSGSDSPWPSHRAAPVKTIEQDARKKALEEAAKVCDERAAGERAALVPNLQYRTQRAKGADLCAMDIRGLLATAPPDARISPAGVAVEPVAWAITFNGEFTANVWMDESFASAKFARLQKAWPAERDLRELVPLYAQEKG